MTSTLNLVGAFFLSYAVFVLVFRVVSAPDARHGATTRTALGAAAAFAVTVGALWMSPGPWTLFVVAAGACSASIVCRGDGFRELTEALGRARFWVYLLAVTSLAALVYLFVPITTFLTSPGELSIHMDYLLTANAHNAMVMVYLAALLYMLAFTPRMKTVLTLFSLGALALALLYAFILPFGYPMLTGLAFEQVPITPLQRAPRILADVAMVVCVALMLRLVIRRYGARPLLLGMALVNLSLVVAAGLNIRRELVGGAGGASAAAQVPAQPLRFSREHPNVLIIFLDRFMGSYVESVMQSDPDIVTRLDGFTWYPRTIAAGENTIAGIHPMLGGYDYLPHTMNERHKPLRDLSTEAYNILPYNFSRKGYRVNVVAPRGLGFTMAGDCSYLRMDNVYCSHIPRTIAKSAADRMNFPLNDLAKSNYTDLLVLLASMRVTPYLGKDVLLQRGPWKPFLDHSAGTTFTQWAELHAFAEMTRADATESNYNFISNISAHEPYYMGEDCIPRHERFTAKNDEVASRGHVSLFSLQHMIGARCALLAVADYLDFLKKVGVYDNTRIVIVSDHGIVGAIEDRSTRAVAGGTQGDPYIRTRSVLLVKARDAHGSLQVSEEFKPNAEVPSIVCTEIGGCVNPYLGNTKIETRGRDDPFIMSLVPWQFSLQKPDAFVMKFQFALKGKDPFDKNGWNPLSSGELPP